MPLTTQSEAMNPQILRRLPLRDNARRHPGGPPLPHPPHQSSGRGRGHLVILAAAGAAFTVLSTAGNGKLACIGVEVEGAPTMAWLAWLGAAGFARGGYLARDNTLAPPATASVVLVILIAMALFCSVAAAAASGLAGPAVLAARQPPGGPRRCWWRTSFGGGGSTRRRDSCYCSKAKRVRRQTTWRALPPRRSQVRGSSSPLLRRRCCSVGR
jgi:hypothetical protein